MLTCVFDDKYFAFYYNAINKLFSRTSSPVVDVCVCSSKYYHLVSLNASSRNMQGYSWRRGATKKREEGEGRLWRRGGCVADTGNAMDIQESRVKITKIECMLFLVPMEIGFYFMVMSKISCCCSLIRSPPKHIVACARQLLTIYLVFVALTTQNTQSISHCLVSSVWLNFLPNNSIKNRKIFLRNLSMFLLHLLLQVCMRETRRNCTRARWRKKKQSHSIMAWWVWAFSNYHFCFSIIHTHRNWTHTHSFGLYVYRILL